MKQPRYGPNHIEKDPEGFTRLYEKAIPNKTAPKYWVVRIEKRDPANPKRRPTAESRLQLACRERSR